MSYITTRVKGRTKVHSSEEVAKRYVKEHGGRGYVTIRGSKPRRK